MPLSVPHHPGELGFDYWLSETNQFNLDPLFSRNGTTERIEGESSEILVDEALAFIEQAQRRDKPAFVMIWYASPHRPFEALDEHMGRWRAWKPPMHSMARSSPWTAPSAPCVKA